MGTVTIAAPLQLIRGNCPEFRHDVRARVAGGASAVVVDFSGCTYVDSTACGTLVTLHRTAKAGGCRFALAALNGDLRTLFELTMLDTLFEMYPTVEAATSAMEAQ